MKSVTTRSQHVRVAAIGRITNVVCHALDVVSLFVSRRMAALVLARVGGDLWHIGRVARWVKFGLKHIFVAGAAAKKQGRRNSERGADAPKSCAFNSFDPQFALANCLSHACQAPPADSDADTGVVTLGCSALGISTLSPYDDYPAGRCAFVGGIVRPVFRPCCGSAYYAYIAVGSNLYQLKFRYWQRVQRRYFATKIVASLVSRATSTIPDYKAANHNLAVPRRWFLWRRR